MEEPLFAQEIKTEVKKEEPSDDFPQEEPPTSQLPLNEERETPSPQTQAGRCLDCGLAFYRLGDLLKHCHLFRWKTHFYCESCDMVDIDLALHQSSKYHLSAVGREPVRRAMKRPFPSLENVVDIKREIDPQEGAKEEIEEEETKPSEEQPFVGTLPPAFSCPRCGEAFHVFVSLQSHVLEKHPGSPPLSCRLCSKMYHNVGSFSSHLLKMHGVTPPEDHPGGYECDECGGHYRQREKYASHCQFFRGKPHFFCNLCKEAVFTSDGEEHEAMTKHRNRVEARRREEWHQQLMKIYQGAKDSEVREQEHRDIDARLKRPGIEIDTVPLDFQKRGDSHSENSERTEIDKESSGKMEDLGGKNWMPHPEDLSFKTSLKSVEKAARTMNSVDILRQEAPIVKQEIVEEEDQEPPPSEDQAEVEPFVGTLPFTFHCPKCPMGFHVFSALRSHTNLLHPIVSPLWCPSCPRRYKMVGSFWYHLKKMHGVDKPPDHPGGYLCDQCGGHFRLRENYAFHCQFYRDIPHLCVKECGFIFLTAPHLKNHMEAHARSPTRCSPLKYPAVTGLNQTYTCLDWGKGMDKKSHEDHRENLKMVPHAYCQPCGKVLDSEEWEKHQEEMGHGGLEMHFYCCKAALRPEDWEEHQMKDGHRESNRREPVEMPFSCHHCPDNSG